MVTVRASDKDFLRVLENGIQFGQAVIVEKTGEDVDSILDPILLRQTVKESGSLCYKLGDSLVPLHTDFRLIFTTDLTSPHYLPEVCVKVRALKIEDYDS